jgi:hypothetical protein
MSRERSVSVVFAIVCALDAGALLALGGIVLLYPVALEPRDYDVIGGLLLIFGVMAGACAIASGLYRGDPEAQSRAELVAALDAMRGTVKTAEINRPYDSP